MTSFRPADIDFKWTKAISSPATWRRLSSLCKKDFVAVYLRRLDSLRHGFHHLFITSLRSFAFSVSLSWIYFGQPCFPPIQKGPDFSGPL